MRRKPAWNSWDSDELALLAAIHADPGSDTPRLIYADWLEERGDPLADLIRKYVAEPTETYLYPVEPDEGPSIEEIRVWRDAISSRIEPLPRMARGFRMYKGLPIVNFIAHNLTDIYDRATQLRQRLCPLCGIDLEVSISQWVDLTNILGLEIMDRVHHLSIDIIDGADLRYIQTLQDSPHTARIASLTLKSATPAACAFAETVLTPLCRLRIMTSHEVKHAL